MTCRVQARLPEFALGDRVRIQPSGQHGVVVGLSRCNYGPHVYRVRLDGGEIIAFLGGLSLVPSIAPKPEVVEPPCDTEPAA